MKNEKAIDMLIDDYNKMVDKAEDLICIVNDFFNENHLKIFECHQVLGITCAVMARLCAENSNDEVEKHISMITEYMKLANFLSEDNAKK